MSSPKRGLGCRSLGISQGAEKPVKNSEGSMFRRNLLEKVVFEIVFCEAQEPKME